MSVPSLELVTNSKTLACTDLITETVHVVENLTKENALGMVSELLFSIDSTYFNLGGVLSRIQEGGWYAEAGYKTFKEYIEGEHNMKYRKAMYMIEVYGGLVASGVPWSSVSHLGWTKILALLPVLTLDNMDYWIPISEKSTVIEIKGLVKAHQLSGTSGSGDEDEDEDGGGVSVGTTSTVTTLTFKLHQDQKESIRLALDKAKEDLGTEYDTVALDMICQSFLEGGVALELPKTSLQDVMHSHSWRDVLTVFSELWPEVNVVATL